MRVREGAIIELATTQGLVGIGEIAPLPDFVGGTLADVLRLLPDVTACLQGKTLRDAFQWLDGVALPSALQCGLEMALFDVLGHCEQKPLASLLTSVATQPRSAMAVNAVVGAPSTQTAVQEAQRAVQAGFGCVKLKVGCMPSLEEELERVAAVRSALGAAARLRLDANEAWTLEQAQAMLTTCAGYDIQYIEQPLSRHDLYAMCQLRQSVTIPIAADEAVGDLASARIVIATRAADILVIKPQLCGGLRNAQRIIQAAEQRGVQCVITTTIESGISLVAALHLAAATPQVTLACGLATAHLLVDDLVLEPLAVQRGVLSVPQGVGLGVTLDRKALKQYEMI